MMGRPQRLIIDTATVPRFAPHARLHHDRPGERWVVLAPERMFELDEIAVEVLQRVDGRRSVADMAADLAAGFDAPVEVVEADVIGLLQELADRMVVTA
jgi:pyrroloquinoline quinone biosynthesis protein D